jgi:polyphenol oxidase
MSFSSSQGLRYYQFEGWGDGITHAVFTRHGGVSPAPWQSLNVGGTVGDEPGRVSENRRRALQIFGCAPETVFDAWQVHGTNVAFANAPRPASDPYPQADIILTDRVGVTLMMRFADCVPIFLYDPIHRVIGLAHAGWMGTVKAVARMAVEAMKEHYGSSPAEICAAIGPSIGPDHYEIGPDVQLQVVQAFGSLAHEVLSLRNGSIYFDLWKSNRIVLQNAGVKQIQTAELCTACHTEDWFSHRAEKGQTGRFGAIIALNER